MVCPMAVRSPLDLEAVEGSIEGLIDSNINDATYDADIDRKYMLHTVGSLEKGHFN